MLPYAMLCLGNEVEEVACRPFDLHNACGPASRIEMGRGKDLALAGHITHGPSQILRASFYCGIIF